MSAALGGRGIPQRRPTSPTPMRKEASAGWRVPLGRRRGLSKVRPPPGALQERSRPALTALVPRPATIDVTYHRDDGTGVEATLRGREARVFQHELDHLDGVLFTDRPGSDSSQRSPTW